MGLTTWAAPTRLQGGPSRWGGVGPSRFLPRSERLAQLLSFRAGRGPPLESSGHFQTPQALSSLGVQASQVRPQESGGGEGRREGGR